MNNIEVKILNHSLSGMPLFLAKLTQRGHTISSMDDLMKLYNENIDKVPSIKLLELPHTTIQRMCTVTVAIVGLSTKAVSQLRTHAKRCTCISTSTQYSSFESRQNNYVIPAGLSPEEEFELRKAYDTINTLYSKSIEVGTDKDKAGYLLPQGLRKAFIMHASIDDWNYILSTRLCHRNTLEVQYICSQIFKAINDINPVWLSKALPRCCYGPCPEGKFCCGQKFELKEIVE